MGQRQGRFGGERPGPLRGQGAPFRGRLLLEGPRLERQGQAFPLERNRLLGDGYPGSGRVEGRVDRRSMAGGGTLQEVRAREAPPGSGRDEHGGLHEDRPAVHGQSRRRLPGPGRRRAAGRPPAGQPPAGRPPRRPPSRPGRRSPPAPPAPAAAADRGPGLVRVDQRVQDRPDARPAAPQELQCQREGRIGQGLRGRARLL